MKFSRIPGLLGSTLLAGALVIACAASAGDDDGTGDPDSGSSGTTTGGTSPTSTGTSTPAPPTGTPTKDSGTSTPDASTTDGSTAADTGTSGGDGGSSGGDGGTTNPGVCAQTGSCPGSVQDIGTVSGDTGAGTITKVGSGSGFFKVRVTEDDAGFLSPKPVKSKYTLTSPPGANYDLVFYYDASNNSISATNCTHTGETTGTQQIKVQSLSWPDSQSIGGHDDASNVTVEVRFTSGTCNAGDQWQLLIEGNQ